MGLTDEQTRFMTKAEQILTKKDLDILFLYAIQKRRVLDIAADLKITVFTVSHSLDRSIEKLKRALGLV